MFTQDVIAARLGRTEHALVQRQGPSEIVATTDGQDKRQLSLVPVATKDSRQRFAGALMGLDVDEIVHRPFPNGQRIARPNDDGGV